MSGFKLNFESQFDILYAIFCFNFPQENFGKLWCRRGVFKPVLGQNVGFQT